jgi:pimeloyl-ACP methyl ester carboxylesterase
MSSEAAGNPDGPPLLLLHGFLSCGAQWDLNRERLGERFRLIVVELMGHGRSDAPDESSWYGPDHVLAELERIRIDHGVDRWWVCGQSLGGAIAARYALTHPDRALGLVFTNSRAAFGIARPGVRQIIPDVISSTREISVHPVNATRLPDAVKDRLVAAADATPLHVAKLISSHRDAWRSVDQMVDLTIPTLLVNGRWEKAFQRALEEVRETISHVEIVDLEGGHAINIEQAEGFDAAVLDFVERRG